MQPPATTQNARFQKKNPTKNEQFNVTLIKTTTESAVPEQCIDLYIAGERAGSDCPPRRSLPASPCRRRGAAQATHSVFANLSLTQNSTYLFLSKSSPGQD